MIRLSVLLVACTALAVAPLAAAQQSSAARRAAIDAMYPVMIKALETGNFGQARNICDQAILWEPENPVHHYNLACIEARAGGARLQHAIPALQRAAELGFYEIGTVKKDPDLDPIRRDPRFTDIVRHVLRNAEQKARADALRPPLERATSGPAATPSSPRGIENAALLNAGDTPAPASFERGLPVGLYFMTRLWAFTGTLEQLVWYFAPDGTVYQSLEHGFSPADLARHAGPRGTCTLEADRLEVKWSGGQKSSGVIQRSPTNFSWDGGVFTPVRPFAAEIAIAGIYEGDAALSFSGNRAAVAKTFELRPDGTFRWSGVSFLTSASDVTQVTAAGTGIDSTGRWHASGYSLVLVDSTGTVFRRIAFPHDDETTPVKPDRIFFAGTLFMRHQ